MLNALSLPGGGDEMLEVAAPSGRVVARAIAARLSPIEDILNPATEARGSLRPRLIERPGRIAALRLHVLL